MGLVVATVEVTQHDVFVAEQTVMGRPGRQGQPVIVEKLLLLWSVWTKHGCFSNGG